MATCSGSDQGRFTELGSSFPGGTCNCKSNKDYNSNKVGLSLDSLPALNSQSILANTVRSRKPLSSSQAEALDNILTDGPYPLQPRNKCYESGYFSEESKLSLYRTTNENLTNGDQIENFNKESLEALLAEIAEEFGCCWKEVGRRLLRKECSIENINEDYNKVSEKSYQMLIKWKKESGSLASITDIFKCLNHIGKEDVAEKLLGYLPEGIARECEMILLSSPKKIRCESMTTPIHNIQEQHKDLTVEKQLRIQDDEEIYLCTSKITKKKFLLKEIEEHPKVYRWAARLVISDKQLSLKKKTLRKTNEFLRDLQFKEETVARLKSITESLQEKLHVKHMTFCEEELNCSNCEKTALMRELLEKDLSLLHHELANMIKGNRRLSVSGIPTERIYELADRAYSVCEEHKKFHNEIRKFTKLSRRCSMELLDSDDTDAQSELNSIEDPLQCTLNILRHFGRKRKVVQSLTVKERKKLTKKVQRHFSDKSKSRFYVPVDDVQGARPNWPARIGSKIFPQRKRSTEKKQRRISNETQKKETPRGVKTLPQNMASNKLPEKDDCLKHHPRCNTFPSSLADLNVSKPPGPEDLDLDDIYDAGSVFSCMKDLRISNGMSHVPGQLRDKNVISNTSTSDPNLQEIDALRRDCMTRTPSSSTDGLCGSRSPGVIEILSRKQFLERRQRSFSDDDVKEASKRYQETPIVQQSSPELSTVSDVLWKTEIDITTIFFV